VVSVCERCGNACVELVEARPHQSRPQHFRRHSSDGHRDGVCGWISAGEHEAIGQVGAGRAESGAVQRQDVAKRSRGRALLDKPTYRHRRERTIRHLLEHAARTRAIAEEHADPEHALDAHGCDFDERPITHFIRDGEHAPVREVHVADGRAVRLKRSAGDTRIHAQMLLNTFVVGRRKSGEKTIVEWRAVRQKPS